MRVSIYKSYLAYSVHHMSSETSVNSEYNPALGVYWSPLETQNNCSVACFEHADEPDGHVFVLEQSMAKEGECSTCDRFRLIMNKTDGMIIKYRKKIKQLEQIVEELQNEESRTRPSSGEPSASDLELQIFRRENEALKAEMQKLAKQRDKSERAYQTMKLENESMNKNLMVSGMRVQELRGEVKLYKKESEKLKAELKSEQRDNGELYALLDLTNL